MIGSEMMMPKYPILGTRKKAMEALPIISTKLAISGVILTPMLCKVLLKITSPTKKK